MKEVARGVYNFGLSVEASVLKAQPHGTPLLLLGTGRGGTTLMMETLSAGFSAAPIFEPMAPHATRRNHRHLPNHGYVRLRPQESHPYLEHLFERALSGRLWNRWTLGHSSVREVRSSARVIVKEVRANRLAGWLNRSFPETHLVLMVRNPTAVVDSMLRAAQGWSQMSWEQIVPPAAAALDVPLSELPGQNSHAALWLASLWIADTRLALAESGPGASILAFEDLLAAPQSVLGPFEELGDFRMDAAISRLGVPSRTADSASHKGIGIPAAQRRDVIQLCRQFGIDFYGLSQHPIGMLRLSDTGNA